MADTEPAIELVELSHEDTEPPLFTAVTSAADSGGTPQLTGSRDQSAAPEAPMEDGESPESPVERSGEGTEESPVPSDSPYRSAVTQTEPPPDGVDGADGVFPVRRAVSDWALTDRSRRTAHIRSERIRRTAQLFEDLVQAQEERETLLTARRRGLRGPVAPARAVSAPPPPEREVLLVLLPSPPAPPPSRQVDAILAHGSGPGADSDAEGDEWDENALWEKVRAKIAARRSKFRRLESGQDEPQLRKPAPANESPRRLSTERTSWLTNGKPAASPPTAPEVAAPKQAPAPSSRQGAGRGPTAPKPQQRAAAPRQQNAAGLASQRAAEPSQEAPPKQPVAARRQLKAAAGGTQNGHATDATRSSFEKYIEQREEQEVLRSLGSAVLAKQRLSAKEKARQQLLNDRAEAERRQRKAENQRTDAQGRLQKTKGKLTRDSAFERKGLETLISRLDGTIREETRKISKLTTQVADVDAEIEELRRRAAA
ncbi:atherin-like [Amphibalanus amphitrite]|uniref:atherin-like n=1 Tax=Amphibalanus amphitrite TaxID=1232801 RepID=UPI001C913F11|nr:atherin-like [Amphibalanus amphitrite]